MKGRALALAVVVAVGSWLAYELEGAEREHVPARSQNAAAKATRATTTRGPDCPPREPSLVRPAREEDVRVDRTVELERIIARQNEEIRALEELLHGAVEAWPEDMQGQDEATVARTLSDALESCQLGSGDGRVFADCSEPPCVAILEAPAPSFQPWKLGQCEVWTAMYGGMISTSYRTAECEDGAIGIQIFTAGSPGWWEAGEAEGAVVEKRWDRMQVRNRLLLDSFCEMRQAG